MDLNALVNDTNETIRRRKKGKNMRKTQKTKKLLLSIILVFGMIIGLLQGSGSIIAEAADENPMRALWLRPKETSKAQVETVVEKIYNAGINTIFLETVFNGYTIFPVTYDGTYLNPDYNGFDVLAAYVDACHSRGMQLHCWVESFFIGMAWEDAGGPVYETYKDKGWLLTDKDGVNYEDTMYGPMYFLNPARPECRDWIVNLYAKFVSEYDVDGIQLDYCRYPEKTSSKDYGYDDYTINAFIQAGGSDPTNAQEGSAVAEAFVAFKQEQVTKFVKQCSDTLREIKPELIISLSVYPFYDAGKSSFMQSAGLWMEKGYGDLIVPMAYYENQIDSISQSTLELTEGRAQNVVIGLLTQGSFSSNSMKRQTDKVLNKGAGVAYFEYESFFGEYNGTNYSTTLKQGPLSDTEFNIDPKVYASYVDRDATTPSEPGDEVGDGESNVSVDIISKNVYYGETLNLMFAVDAQNLSDGDEVRLVLTKGGVSVSASYYKNQTVNGVDATIFKADKGVAPQNLDDEYTAKAQIVNQGKVVAESEEYTYSVLAYLYERLYITEGVTSEKRSLYAKLIDYAAAAEAVLNSGTTTIEDSTCVIVSGGTIDGENSWGICEVGDTLSNLTSDITISKGYVLAWEIKEYSDIDGGQENSTTILASEIEEYTIPASAYIEITACVIEDPSMDK